MPRDRGKKQDKPNVLIIIKRNVTRHASWLLFDILNPGAEAKKEGQKQRLSK